jgi:hypothetical protein
MILLVKVDCTAHNFLLAPAPPHEGLDPGKITLLSLCRPKPQLSKVATSERDLPGKTPICANDSDAQASHCSRSSGSKTARRHSQHHRNVACLSGKDLPPHTPTSTALMRDRAVAFMAAIAYRARVRGSKGRFSHTPAKRARTSDDQRHLLKPCLPVPCQRPPL